MKLLVNCLGNTVMHLKLLESSWFAQIFYAPSIPILQLMRFLRFIERDYCKQAKINVCRARALEGLPNPCSKLRQISEVVKLHM